MRKYIKQDRGFFHSVQENIQTIFIYLSVEDYFFLNLNGFWFSSFINSSALDEIWLIMKMDDFIILNLLKQ